MDLIGIPGDVVNEFNTQAHREHKTRYNALKKLRFRFIDSHFKEARDLLCFLDDGETDYQGYLDDDGDDRICIFDGLIGRALSVIELIPLNCLHMLSCFASIHWHKIYPRGNNLDLAEQPTSILWSNNTGLGAGFIDAVVDKNDEQLTARVEIHLSLEVFQHSQDRSAPTRQIRDTHEIIYSLLKEIGLCLFNKRIYDLCIQDPKTPNPIWDNSGICELITNFKNLHEQQSILCQTLDIAAQQDAWADILAGEFAKCLYQRYLGNPDKTQDNSIMGGIIELMFEDEKSMIPVGIEFGSHHYITYPCILTAHGNQTHKQITLPAYFLPPADQVIRSDVSRSGCWPSAHVLF